MGASLKKRLHEPIMNHPTPGLEVWGPAAHLVPIIRGPKVLGCPTGFTGGELQKSPHQSETLKKNIGFPVNADQQWPPMASFRGANGSIVRPGKSDLG